MKESDTAPPRLDYLDASLPYYSGPMQSRLKAHPTTDPEFVHLFITAAGGGLREQDGGNWERTRRANASLRPREARSKLDDRKHLVARIEGLEYDKRKLLELHARAAGVETHYTLPSLTEGEALFYKRLSDYVEIHDLEDMVECITTAFPGAEVTITSDDAPGTGGEVSVPTSSSESAPDPVPPAGGKRVRVLEDDLLIPPGYLEGTDLSGNATEIKKRINAYLHAHLVAEIEGKNRKGVTDWLMGKLRGFKVPEEMRVKEETDA